MLNGIFDGAAGQRRTPIEQRRHGNLNELTVDAIKFLCRNGKRRPVLGGAGRAGVTGKKAIRRDFLALSKLRQRNKRNIPAAENHLLAYGNTLASWQ